MIDFALCAPQCFRFVAQHAFGRLFDAFAQPADALVGDAHRLAGLALDAHVDQAPSNIHRVFYALLMSFAHRVVKLLGK